MPCLHALHDSQFAEKTIVKNKLDYPAFRSSNEVLINSVFRFLHVRGYIDNKHNLTTWGKVLETALAVSDDESTIIGVEMLRLGLFTSNFATGTPPSKTGLFRLVVSGKAVLTL